MEEMAKLINDVGLGIAVVVWFAYRDMQKDKELKTSICELIKAINKISEKINTTLTAALYYKQGKQEQGDLLVRYSLNRETGESDG